MTGSEWRVRDPPQAPLGASESPNGSTDYADWKWLTLLQASDSPQQGVQPNITPPDAPAPDGSAK
jgi:hypothetical protein